MKNRKWLFRVLLFLLIWAFAEVCGFVGMKIASQPNPYMSYGDYFKIRKNLLGEADAASLPRYLPTPSLNYIPTPGYEYGGVVQHCTAGFRGPSIPLKKTDAIRILFLGGSTTYGSGVWHPDSTYPAQTGVFLKEIYPDKDFEIINAGAESATSAEELAYYHFKFRYYEPDIVVLHTGGNDALTGPKEPYYQPDHSNFRNINFSIPELSGFGKLAMRSYFLSFLSINFYYKHLVEYDHVLQVREKQRYAQWFNAEDVDSNRISPDGFYNNIDMLLEEIKRDGHQVMLMPFVINEEHAFSKQNPDYVMRVTEINSLLQGLATMHQATWIPFSKSTISNAASWQDDCHLNDAGERDKAMLVSYWITTRLQANSPPDVVPFKLVY
jgi:hypothetical protein